MKVLLQMWLNSASFTSCAKKSSLSQLCSLISNLTKIDNKSAAKNACMTATSTLLFFVQRAKELGLYSQLRLNVEDLQVVKALIRLTGQMSQENLSEVLTCLGEVLEFVRSDLPQGGLQKHCFNPPEAEKFLKTVDSRDYFKITVPLTLTQ